VDEYEQYLADAEYEDYLRQAQAEQASIGPVQPDTQNIDLSNAIARGSSDFMAPANPLGPDYNKGYLANAWEGIKEAPAAVGHMASDVYNFVNPWANGGAGGPIDTIMGAGAEKTAQNVGGFSSGLAGAGALAPIGAGWGSMLGPLGAFAGGALGGGVGFYGGYGRGCGSSYFRYSAPHCLCKLLCFSPILTICELRNLGYLLLIKPGNINACAVLRRDKLRFCYCRGRGVRSYPTNIGYRLSSNNRITRWFVSSANWRCVRTRD